MRTLRCLVGLVVLAWAVLATGCMRPPPTRIGFNEKIAKAVRKLGNLGRKLHKSLEPLSKGTAVTNISGVTNDIDKTLAQFDIDFDDQLLPLKSSSSAPDLKSAFEKFLEVEKKMTATNVKNITTILATPGLSPKDQWSRVEQEMQAMNATEQAALTALRDAQVKYVGEHNFRLVRQHAN